MARSVCVCVNVIASKAIFQFRNYATKLQASPAALQSCAMQLTRAINWLPAILADTASMRQTNPSLALSAVCRLVKQINAFHGR